MAPRARSGQDALTRQWVLSVSVLLGLAVLSLAAAWAGLALVTWVGSVALLVVAGLAAGSLAGRQVFAACGLAAGSPVVAGSIAATYDAGRTPGAMAVAIGSLLLPLVLWWCRHRFVRRIEGPPDTHVGLRLFD